MRQTQSQAIPKWFSVDDVAIYLGVNRDTIYKWLERKQMPGHKVGRLWKFKMDEIDQWIVSGKSGKENMKRKAR